LPAINATRQKRLPEPPEGSGKGTVKDQEKSSDQGKHGSNSDPGMDIERIISYNFSEGERPEGIKIRAKIRIVGGRQAEALDARQAEAIRELLIWARQYRQQRERS
jgi:hypothetical protein